MLERRRSARPEHQHGVSLVNAKDGRVIGETRDVGRHCVLEPRDLAKPVAERIDRDDAEGVEWVLLVDAKGESRGREDEMLNARRELGEDFRFELDIRVGRDFDEGDGFTAHAWEMSRPSSAAGERCRADQEKSG
jgi:hypothetical protein